MADLAPGELLLWSVEPYPGALFLAKHGVVGILLPLIVSAFFIGNILGAPGGFSWLLVGFVALVFGGFIYDFLTGCWTLYGITNRRLIIVHPSMFSVIVESYYPPDIDFIRKTRRKNGSGNLVFSAIREKKGKRTQTVEIGFFGIESVDEIEGMILSLRDLKKPAVS